MTGGGMPVQQAPPPRPRSRPVTVEEVVETDVITAQPGTPIVSIVADMATADVGSVVITDGDTPVGIITDRQIALALETTADMSESIADEFLTEDLVTGSTDMSVFDALQRLNDMDVRRLPIVDENGALEGIVTLDDIIVLLGTELGNVADIIRAQSPRL
jgi:CBS domain-containing protein